MKIVLKLGACIVGMSLCCASAVAKRPEKVLKVKIEATALDRKMLLRHLNEDGADRRMRFEVVEGDCDYRIVFATGQSTTQATCGVRAVRSIAASRQRTYSTQRENRAFA